MSFLSKLAKFASGIDNFINGGSLTRKVINSRIKEYGEMLELKLDNKAKTARVKVLLKGESEPVEIVVNKYELSKGNGKSSLRILKASSDRLWLDAALRNFVVGKDFNIPEKASDYMEDFLG